MSKSSLLLVALLVAGIPQESAGSGPLRRFLLAVGANSGGADRITLQYAVSDAENFADVMMGMGGVERGDGTVLRQPDLRSFREALANLGPAVSETRAAGGRTEVVVYYSGHADESGLLVGGERFDYMDLRQRMDRIDADVRITVLDACASGAITRLKGGQRRQAFLVDESSDMHGYAFLTSSSVDEAAQESDAIGSSFFTHYLISGMRGAADLSGEGRVTLNEVYQFAFHETLAQTTDTRGGPQHPAYHINLSGTGDVVMTDVRHTSAGLVLPEELQGRFFVRNADKQLVAELYKPSGRSVELGLEPGMYSVHLDRQPDLFLAHIELESGRRLVLREDAFESTDRTEAFLRGPYRWRPDRGALDGLNGRYRLELRFGGWTRGPVEQTGATGGGVGTRVGSWGPMVRVGFSRWFSEDLSLGLDFSAVGEEVKSHVGGDVSNQVLTLSSLFVEARKYVPGATLSSALRPRITAGIGILMASLDGTTVNPSPATVATTMAAMGTRLGGGLDIQISRPFMIGADAALNLFTDFSEPFGGRKNYSGFEGTVGISWLLGKGTETGRRHR